MMMNAVTRWAQQGYKVGETVLGYESKVRDGRSDVRFAEGIYRAE